MLRHPFAVYAGGGCLLLQLLFALGYRRLMARYRGKIRALVLPADLLADRRPFGWFAWLQLRFRSDDSNAPVPPDRVAALGELDWHLQSSFSLSALQRLGYVAPLIGLLLTAGGFFLFNPESDLAARPPGPPTDGANLGAVLRATLPLMLGVGIGACLALVNQFLLLLVQASADRTRGAGRDWFDRMAATVPGGGNPLVPVANALRDQVGDVQQSIRTFAAAANGSKAATDKLAEAAAAQQRAAGQLTEQLTATSTLAKGFNQAAINTEAASAAMEAAVRSQQQWGQAGGRASEDLAATVAGLRGQVDELRKVIESQGQVVTAWKAAVQNELAPAQTAFTGALAEFRAAASGLAEGVGALGTAANRATDQVQTLTGTTATAVSQFGVTVAQLASAVEGDLLPLARSLAPVQGLVNSIAAVGEPLAAAAESVAIAARQHHTSAEHLAPAYAKLTETLVTVAEVTQQIREAQATLGPAVETVARSMATVAEAGRQVGELTAGGLEPMAGRLAQIDQVVETLTAVVGSLRPLSGTGELVTEMRQFALAFDQMAQATDQQRQIAELLRDVVEAARGRRSLFSRLFGQ